MEAADVLELLDALEGAGVPVWVDGGWGVDALLGEETRRHGDLDLVTPRGDLRRVRRLLAARGYVLVRDWRPTTLALRDPDGREVDLHLVDPTPDGGGDQVLDGGGVWHDGPPVTGTVGGRPAPCAPAEEQLALHQGYDPRPVDVADVGRLVARFGLQAPPAYT